MKYLPSKFPIAKVLKYSVITLVLLVISSPVLYVANDYRLKSKYERGLNHIRIGDSRQTVASLMGEPDMRNWCYPLPTDHDTSERKRFHERCVDTYEYVVFLKSYVITFDKDNRVSGKNYTISP